MLQHQTHYYSWWWRYMEWLC